jgi:transposase-like protein
VRGYLAHNLTLRNPEEMMAKRGISVDHATIRGWFAWYMSELLMRFKARRRAAIDQ